jgi:hypothetical protein
MAAMTVYIASALGFSESGRYFYHGALIPLLKSLGHTVLDPWTLTDRNIIDAAMATPPGPSRTEAWRSVNDQIGAHNLSAIDRAELLLAVVDGSDVDSGTASEIGYAFARRKRIIAYRSDFRLAADNEGALINVQVDYFIRASGGVFISRLDQLSSALTEFPISRDGQL